MFTNVKFRFFNAPAINICKISCNFAFRISKNNITNMSNINLAYLINNNKDTQRIVYDTENTTVSGYPVSTYSVNSTY